MSDLDTRVFVTTAQLQVRATSEELSGLAQGRAPDPAVFAEHPPFFWLNEISSNRLDAYYTRMDPLTTLPNFAADAAAGVAFLIGHDNRTMPFGSTLTGTLETAGDVTRVLADAYALQEPETAPFVRRVRAGIQRDTSVGFHGGQWICSICGKDMLRDWECWHIPGLAYEVKDLDGPITVVREQVAEALIKNARLAEVSAVYDGATPGAAILQAQRQAEAGRIRPEQARLIEARYRIHLPGQRLTVPGATLPPTPAPAAASAPGEERGAADQPNTQETPVPESTPAPDAGERGQPVDQLTEFAAFPVAELRGLFGLAADADPIAHVRQLAAELPQLRAQAADGRAYREELEKSALVEAVRALGPEAEEVNKALLATLPTATVRQMSEAWRAIGNARFPGGRVTTDEAPAEPAPKAAPITEPESLYQG